MSRVLTALVVRGSFPTSDVGDLAAVDVIDEAGHKVDRRQKRFVDEELDVVAKCVGVIGDGQEPEVGAGPSLQLRVGYPRQATARVLHDDDGVDSEHVTRQGQAAHDVVGYRPPAFRMMWASPSRNPSAAKTSIRASIQVTTAIRRLGRASARLARTAAYTRCWQECS